MLTLNKPKRIAKKTNAPFRYIPLRGLLVIAGALILAFLINLILSPSRFDPANTLGALFAYNGSPGQTVTLTIRLPRAVIALSVGACLGVAGAIMQALTRNPLASPGTLGINAGAALLVVATIFVAGNASSSTFFWLAFVGAGLAGSFIFLISSLGHGGITPLKLTVVGATLTTLLTSVSQSLLVLSDSTLDVVRFWLVGSVANRKIELYWQVLPYMIVGLLVALILSRQINILALGEEIAKGLGQKTNQVKLGAALAVVLLAGASVAIAGPIGFVGLAVPHIARSLVGVDYRWLLPYSAILGSIMLLLTDIVAQWVVRPSEVPVGAVTALVGAPFLIWQVRQMSAKRGKDK